jgi:hypothetical protein
MRLTVVGCAGSFPGPTSPASCYLLEAQGFRLVIDMGNGALGALQRYTSALQQIAPTTARVRRPAAQASPDDMLDKHGPPAIRYHVYGPTAVPKVIVRNSGDQARA